MPQPVKSTRAPSGSRRSPTRSGTCAKPLGLCGDGLSGQLSGHEACLYHRARWRSSRRRRSATASASSPRRSRRSDRSRASSCSRPARGTRRPSRKGIAHFAEHMFFKGTERRPTARTISTEIDAIGGEFNAFTGKELTGYYVRCGSETRDVALDVLDGHAPPLAVRRGRDREGEGRDPRGDERLPRHAAALRRERLRPAAVRRSAARLGHPRHAGDDRGRDARDLHVVPRHLVPARAHGRRDRRPDRRRADGAARGAARRHRAAADRARPSEVELPPDTSPVLLHTKDSEQAHLILGVRGYPIGHPNRYALQLLAVVLGGGMSSRLFTEVREKRGLGYYVHAGNTAYTDAGTFYASAGVDVARVDEAITTILGELRKIAAEPVPADELEKARGYAKGRFVLRLESPQGTIQYGLRREVLEGEIEEPDELLAATRRGDGRGRPARREGPLRGQAALPRARRAVRRPGTLREAARRVSDERELLRRTAEIAADFLDSLDERPVFPQASMEEIAGALGGPLPDARPTRSTVVELLAREIERGVVAIAGRRYFGFVIGGALPADARGRLADDDLGPVRRARRARAVGRRSSRRSSATGSRTSSGSRRRVVRVHDGLPDGARDGLAAARHARSRRSAAGTFASDGLAGLASDHASSSGDAPRHRRPRAAAPRARRGAARRRRRRRRRVECEPTRSARRSRASTARRSSARRPAR